LVRALLIGSVALRSGSHASTQMHIWCREAGRMDTG
jgi:hypothetical protein